jgi:hypothetical protein
MGPDDLQGWAFLIAVFTVFVLLVSLIIRYIVRSIIRTRREVRRPRCDCGTTVVHYAPGGKRELGRTVTYDRDCAKCGGSGFVGGTMKPTSPSSSFALSPTGILRGPPPSDFSRTSAFAFMDEADPTIPGSYAHLRNNGSPWD